MVLSKETELRGGYTRVQGALTKILRLEPEPALIMIRKIARLCPGCEF